VAGVPVADGQDGVPDGITAGQAVYGGIVDGVAAVAAAGRGPGVRLVVVGGDGLVRGAIGWAEPGGELLRRSEVSGSRCAADSVSGQFVSSLVPGGRCSGWRRW
jgi:hypothetical protein